MRAPKWSQALLRWLAPDGRKEEVVGDLDEAHRARVLGRGRLVGSVLTGLEAIDMAGALLRQRIRGERAGHPVAGSLPGLTGRRSNRPGISTLDFKLGVRMLLRYPGLTALGGVAMAFAIFIGAGSFEFLAQVAYPKLPLPDGDRVVGIQLFDIASSRTEGRVSFDLVHWRGLETVEDIGAFRNQRRNFITGDGPGSVELVAEWLVDGMRHRIITIHL